ncbi:MAG: aminotransferase class V-fold PLP-dependent enzyme [Desulfotomaculaceae bacterium]|nr:aminotransferase class V-fold PLP-dependent enzyme [Desulfotomaculaceae bacterium]
MIYFDNAATSFPKPKAVIEAMENYFFNMGGTTGRSGHKMALEASELVFNTRESLAQLFNIKDSARIVFTKNVTESLNMAINGFLIKGDRVITTSVEHNSVMRPLRYLEQAGKIKLYVVQANQAGMVDPASFEDILKKESIKLVVFSHASNVTGAVNPIGPITQIVKSYGSNTLIDAAQTAGAYPVDVEADGVDMLAFTGHKALLGPQGTGGLYIREGIEIEPLMRGGTGSNSEREFQPELMPDRLESGTLNVIGLAGLGAGVKYVLEHGVVNLRQKEMALTESFIRNAAKIPDVRLYGPKDANNRVSVVSLNISGYDPAEIAYILDRDFDIACRPGLHCAPSTHKTIGTFPQGTVRFAFGPFNNIEEIHTGLTALSHISQKEGDV